MDGLTRRLLGILLALSAVACDADDGDDMSPEIESKVLAIGAPATDALLGALVARLSGAIALGGPASAVEFCSTQAIDLTTGIALEQGLDIKRTSMRYRNPANAPDEGETEALRHFEAVLAETSTLPADWVQKAGRDEYRYYRALTVAPPCIQCHGTPAAIDAEVQAILDERYPEDLATDYAVGDFRGLVRVSIPADRVEGSGR